MKRVENAPFSPRMVDFTNNLQNTFGKFEVEQDVIKMIKYLSVKGNWRPVSITWLEERIGILGNYEFETANGLQIMDFLEYLEKIGCMTKEHGWYSPTDRFFRILSHHLKPKK